MMILHSNHAYGICILSAVDLSTSTTAGQTLLQHCGYERVLINICKIENQFYYDKHNTNQLHMFNTYIILSVIPHDYEKHKLKERIIVTHYI